MSRRFYGFNVENNISSHGLDFGSERIVERSIGGSHSDREKWSRLLSVLTVKKENRTKVSELTRLIFFFFLEFIIKFFFL